MKRFHLHLSVDNLAQNIQYYSALFGMQPTVSKTDYAKWLLDDPYINFAISKRGAPIGLNHLGIQVDSAEELAEMHTRLAQLETDVKAELGTSCCYAKSDKYWVADPQGLAWETYHTLGDIPLFNTSEASPANGCVPVSLISINEKPTSSCCG